MWRCGLIGLLCFTVVFGVSAQDYAQDIIDQDGPIIYGTGMSPEDSKEAWKHFFFMMTEAVLRQQGQEVLHLKLKQRRDPQNSKVYTIALDANLTGIGGIPEPRKVMVMVLTDCDKPSSQYARIVCTYPAPGQRVLPRLRYWEAPARITDAALFGSVACHASPRGVDGGTAVNMH